MREVERLYLLALFDNGFPTSEPDWEDFDEETLTLFQFFASF